MDVFFGNNCERFGNERKKSRKSQKLLNKGKIYKIKQRKLWYDDFYSNL